MSLLWKTAVEQPIDETWKHTHDSRDYTSADDDSGDGSDSGDGD